MPKRVFISYRREDTAPAAGRLYDRLCQVLSKDQVFFDISAIAGGENFEHKIIAEIERSDVILVLIGKRWLEPSASGGRPRIHQDMDYVRAEVRAALGRAVLLLPILVDGASMPGPEALPEDVGALASRNALFLRHESFDDDVENIARAILGTTAKTRLWDERGTVGTRIGFAIAGAAVALAIVLLGALLHRWMLMRPVSASIGDAATTTLLVTVVIAGALLGLAYERRRRRRPARR